MPSKARKLPPNEKKLDDEIDRLRRKPLYPDLNEEKKNMGIYSSDDSPEKFQYSHSPRMTRKSNSASSTDSMQDSSSPEYRSGRQQNQMNNFQDDENSDLDMQTDDLDDNNYPYNQGEETSEISPNYKLKKHLSPKSEIYENSTNVRRRLIPPEMQAQRMTPSTSISDSIFSFTKNFMYPILFFTILIISYFTFSIYGTRYPDTPFIKDQFNASTLVSSLKSEFNDQPRWTFRIIRSALKNVLEGQPKAPAIILLLATNGSETICGEFAHKLVGSLSVPQYTVKISGKDYKQENTDQAKWKIDKDISNTLKDNVLGSVLIDDVDQIPGNAAMILHKYCDHENAPFKKAVFVMTANYNKGISDHKDTKVWDKAANDHLLSVWTDIGVDQVTPLLARLTVSVAIIKAQSL